MNICPDSRGVSSRPRLGGLAGQRNLARWRPCPWVRVGNMLLVQPADFMKIAKKFSIQISENRRGLEKERVALSRSLTERRSTSLISHLNSPKRRQIPVHKQRLDVVPIDRGVGLEEEPQE